MPLTIEEVRAALVERDAGIETILKKPADDMAALTAKVGEQSTTLIDVQQKMSGASGEWKGGSSGGGGGHESLGSLNLRSDLLTRWKSGDAR
jgi:hypothetical protein